MFREAGWKGNVMNGSRRYPGLAIISALVLSGCSSLLIDVDGIDIFAVRDDLGVDRRATRRRLRRRLLQSLRRLHESCAGTVLGEWFRPPETEAALLLLLH